MSNAIDNRLLAAAEALVRALDKVVDDSLPEEIAEVVKTHSMGAAAAGVAAGWVPGAGGVAATLTSAGFIWTMYGRINDKIDLPFTENVIKSVASGVATNLVAYFAAGAVVGTVFSLFPGIGSVGASVVVGTTA